MSMILVSRLRFDSHFNFTFSISKFESPYWVKLSIVIVVGHVGAASCAKPAPPPAHTIHVPQRLFQERGLHTKQHVRV